MLICKNADNTVRWKPGERLNHYFEQRCDQLPPEQVAVVTEDASVTFRELDNRANQAARYLLSQGLKPGDRIALLFDKSIHGYVALLAVLKIGASYVPLDASFPNDRISFILEDAGVKAIASVSRYREKLGEFAVKQIYFDNVEQEFKGKSAARLTVEEAPPSSDQLFYIIYTSGTTGKPKGVAIDHAGICNFVKVAGEVYGIRVGDRGYQGMTLAFDFHVEDLWVPLIAGATLISGKSGPNLFGNDLHEFLSKHRVTVLPCVPTLWATIEQDLPDVRIVILSGESVPHHLVVRWYRPGRSILNAYGPTECSVSSTIRFLVPDRPVTIGAPLPTYTVVILAEDKDEEVPEGAVGEICIAGIALARGYINREDLTREKFIPDFLNLPNNPSKHIYRTGDLGRIREDGELDFNGRIDTQVKLRGYRIELGEIEAVLMQVPQIAQVVVQPYEVEPGAVDLVAYYTCKPGAPDISTNEVSELLRRNLPGYMVPGYLEELAAIPMTANNKADRKNLPAPKGPRFSATSSKVVEPKTETEKVLLAALMEVMKIDRASIEDNFFHDLGAHSLLMARYGAEIRKRLNISSVSMRDIYLNPTIEKLGRFLDALPKEPVGETVGAAKSRPFHTPSNFSYYGCGALQLAWYFVWVPLGLWILFETIRWTYGAMPDFGKAYLRIMALGVLFFTLSCVVPIAGKWLLIGRWKEESFPVWSLRYFRFWLVKGMVGSSAIGAIGGPFYNIYLRLLGAKVGKNTVISSSLKPLCTDLISIGSHTILNEDTAIIGYKAEGNYIYIGPITLGDNVYVGEASILDINTVMEDNTQLGHASSLHEGQRVPKGKHYHGTPAQETTADYCQIGPMSCTPLRRYTYALLFFPVGFALLPIPVMLLYWLFPYIYDLLGGFDFAYEAPVRDVLLMSAKMLVLTLVFFLVGIALGVLLIRYIPMVLNVFLKPDKTYVLYGVHYFLQQLISASSNSAFFNRLFGDSCGIVHYMQWIGWNLNTIVQSGSNFGEDQKHDNPFLCEIGSGTMVSDGFFMANATTSHSAFKLSLCKVGENTYLGNYIRFPPDAKTGVDCLIGTKTLVPIDGPIREHVGLLGSPCFEIPRAATRDRQMAKMDDEIKRQRLKAKNRYNFVTAVLFLAKTWFGLFVLALAGLLTHVYWVRYGYASIVGFGFFTFFFSVFWAWFVERAAVGFGNLSPQIALALDPYYWFHERHWHMFGLVDISQVFAGTPFKNIFSRLEGVKLGKKVFDNGIRWTEYTLIEVGDYATLNVSSIIWPHSLEEGVFKSDRIKIGKGCTLGTGSLTHYGVTMGDYVVLEPDSYLMKGEILDANTTWRGNPAKAVVGAAANGAAREASATFVAAKVA